MAIIRKAEWVKGTVGTADEAVVFTRSFAPKKEGKQALLEVSALGVYVANLNGARVGDFILAPGWTSYANRVQTQTYDVTAQIAKQNTLAITLGRGWKALSRAHEGAEYLGYRETALIAGLELTYTDGEKELILTDDSWLCTQSPITYNHIYHGETYDAQLQASVQRPALVVEHDKFLLIPQQGEIVREQERLPALALIHTPAGETVLDFGQNLTGYVEFTIRGKAGDEVTIKHAEVLDENGNFYTANLRAAKTQVRFICDGKQQSYKPQLTFYGFRYIKLIDWPDEIKLENFTAIVVHSDMKRTGWFDCGDAMVNQLFHNIVWGQKGNFLDVPTDCPQRDERLGWTGDAQVFVRAAAYNYDVSRFFRKWLADLRADQNEDGSVPHVIPNIVGGGGSAAWSDAAVICPWQMYLSYADTDILKLQYSSMEKWINYMKDNSVASLWVKGSHFGDWLSLEHKKSRQGKTDQKLIATAYYYYSTCLLVKAGKLLDKDVSEYEALCANIAAAFRKRYMKDGRMKQRSQTACCVALFFGLTDNAPETAAQLAELVRAAGHLTTGFVGTPYLQHALSDNGYADVAYDLLLRREFPSWLYPVTMGATTIWERWDSMRPDGTMQDPGMTSFNHYAYGAVGDWLYGVVAGIQPDENKPGYEHIYFRPLPDARLGYANAKLETAHGMIEAGWKYENGKFAFRFVVPESSTATFVWQGKETKLNAGTHEFVK